MNLMGQKPFIYPILVMCMEIIKDLYIIYKNIENYTSFIQYLHILSY